MHLGNGTVTPMCAVYGAGAAMIGLTAGILASRTQRLSHPWRLAAAGAFVFAAQAFNIPVLPSASGHLIGAYLLAHWFGPAWSAIAMSIVLIVQSLLVGDGGTAAIGLNILNMAVLPALLVYSLITRWLGRGRVAVAIGSFASVVVAATAASLELLSQPAARSQAGSLVTTMIAVHAAIGLLEVGMTLAAIELVRLVPEKYAAPGLAIGSVVVLAASMLGSSPWPDGLEYTLEIHGLSELIGARTSDSASMGFVALFVTAGAVLALSSIGRKRGVDAHSNN